MTLFGWLFRKHANPTLDDPAFGHIEYDSHHGVGMWCHIPATPREPMIVIEASPAGPTQTQREFYATLRNTLATLESECKRFISKQENPPVNLAAMTVYSIEIGPEEELESGDFVIELADEDADQIHRVAFSMGKPEAYGVDD